MAGRMVQRAIVNDADLFTTVVTAQEAVQGWLAVINREVAGQNQVFAYGRFLRLLTDFHKITVLPFDAAAASVFHRLQAEPIRIGTMDLKIAAICIAHDALLLTRNLVDFEKVRELRQENWLD